MAQRQSGLGRGLEALLPGARETAPPRNGLREVLLDDIVPNPNQPRVHFDESSLDELAESIREVGVIQPILLRPLPNGTFELIAGERRWRASRKAGLTTIPAVVRDTTELQSMEQALVENLQRADLTPLEEASSYQQFIDDFSYTHEKLAKRVGKSRAAITNSLRLLQLPPAIQQMLADGRLKAGHARALLGTGDRAFQEQLARRAASEDWSVRAVEDAVRERELRPSTGATPAATPTTPGGATATDGSTAVGSRLRSPAVIEVEDLLSDLLATRVTISTAGTRGKVVIEFADLEDLDRIYREIARPQIDE